MTKEVRRRSGTGAQHTTFTGAPAEVTVDTTDNRLVVHDGVTAGGHPVAKESEITSATAGIANKLPKDGSEAMSGNLDLNGNNLVDVGNINGGPMGGYRNKIINGDFDIWQRATSFSSVGSSTYDADRSTQNRDGSGATINITREDFTLGQTDVPGNPKYYRRFAQTVAGSGGTYGNCYIQNIEGVNTLAGKTITLTFYAKAPVGTVSTTPNMAQVFGSGGSPSSPVYTAGSGVSLTTSWQKISQIFTIPSIASKTLGTDGNDFLQVYISAPLNAVQTIDIAHVSLVEGDATNEDDPFSPRHIGQELALCQRYYQTIPGISTPVRSVDATWRIGERGYPVVMRTTPTFTVGSYNGGGTPISVATSSYFLTAATGVTSSAASGANSITLDAEL